MCVLHMYVCTYVCVRMYVCVLHVCVVHVCHACVCAHNVYHSHNLCVTHQPDQLLLYPERNSSHYAV